MVQMKINKKEYLDKLQACWVGKNIGGTIGGPFECKTEMQDISGFVTPKGEPLPNDDLDLQLVWLAALEKFGPANVDANVLAEYWLAFIPPHWNEYGIGKSNLRMGLLPPLSGEFRNEHWKNSNGAWIRSEIWACLCPGHPYTAIRYAIMDASIDHGVSEGTYAEVFTAAMESLAFFEKDIRKIIDKAITFIPEDSMLSRCIRLVLREYDKKTPYREVREMIVAESKELGWFQAPANVAFAVLGIVYGEGDFKKTLIYAVNCGDDTDCTAATAGAFLGIWGGMSIIPQDWYEYIGDRIICLAADRSTNGDLPRSCTELTERVLRLMPQVMRAHDLEVEFTDGDTEFDPGYDARRMGWVIDDFFSRSPYSFEFGNIHTGAIIEYEKEPQVRAGDLFKVKITLYNKMPDPRHVRMSVALPEGWSADYAKTAYIEHNLYKHAWEMTVLVGEAVSEVNRIIITVDASDYHPVPLMIPVTLLG